MKLPKFVRLAAHIEQDEGIYALNIKFVDEKGGVFDVDDLFEFPRFEEAAAQVVEIADEFNIPHRCISLKIQMQRYRDQIFH